MKNYYALLLLLVCFYNTGSAQTYYYATYNDFTNTNYIYQGNLETCTKTLKHHYSGDYVIDVAVDQNDKFYYYDLDANLYKFTSTVVPLQYLGSYGYIGNSLVAAGNMLYLAGSEDIFYYNTETNTGGGLGTLPAGYIAAGDLFFYESRLFLTAIYNDSYYHLLEINMQNPSESCLFMELGMIFESMAAFSIEENGSSRVFITMDTNMVTSTLNEIDMVNKTFSQACTYNELIYGAASQYALTSNNSTCQTMGTPLLPAKPAFVNPVGEYLETAINTQFETVIIYDVSGRKVKALSQANTYTGDLPRGIYLAEFISGTDKKTAKLIKK